MSHGALEKAKIENNKGCEYFNDGKFKEAMSCYSKGIKLCDAQHKEELSALFSNRSIAHLKLHRYTSVISDATRSITLDNKHSEALYGRYCARLGLKQFQEALVDITAVCLLEKGDVQENVTRRTALLKLLAVRKAEQCKQNLPKFRVPDKDVKEYVKDFKNHPLFGESFDAEKMTSFMANLENTPNIENREAKKFLTESTMELLINNRNSAVKLAKKAVKSVKNDTKLKVTAMIQLAESLLHPTSRLGSSSIDEVFKIYKEAKRMDEENVDIYLHRAIVYCQVHLYDESLKDLERCVSLEPSFESPYLFIPFVRLAASHVKNDRETNKAFKEAEKYIREHPSSVDAPVYFSNVFRQRGETNRALDIISKALLKQPKNVHLLKQKAEVVFENDRQAAEPLILQALGSNSIHDRELFLMMSCIAREKGDFEEALKYIDKAITTTRSEYDLLCCLYARETLSSLCHACQLLGVDTNNKHCSSVIKHLAIKRATLDNEACFDEISSLSDEISDDEGMIY